jgi:hypothetical protein
MGQGLFDRVASIWRQLIEGYGMRLQMEDIVAEGDLVAVRYTETGTFNAAAFGREPTGKSSARGDGVVRDSRWKDRETLGSQGRRLASASTWGSRALVRAWHAPRLPTRRRVSD